jgi:AcrR family transcriptional regulator
MPRVSRRTREQDLVRATRRVFDARGVHDAPIEEVAREAGLNKALIYRHFGSKEELYADTLAAYLNDLRERLAEPGEARPEARLAGLVRRFVGFCREYPAFAVLALQLMREPIAELRPRVSDAVLLRLGEAMAGCLAVVAATLRAGAAAGRFQVDDADREANLLFARCLGVLQLGRLGAGVRLGAQGVPDLFPITGAEIERQCVEDALAAAGAAREEA